MDIITYKSLIIEGASATIVEADEARPSEFGATEDTLVEVAHP